MKKTLSHLFLRYNEAPEIVRLGINALLLGLLWVLFYRFFRHFEFVNSVYSFATVHFTAFILGATKSFLELLGYEAEIKNITVRIIGTAGIYLDKGCLARNLMGLYAGFILAYPGKIKTKLWYLPLGLLIINILNVFRLAGMAILVDCCPSKVDFNHHYVFKIVVFGFIFLLWYIWVFRIGGSTKTETVSELKPEIDNSEK